MAVLKPYKGDYFLWKYIPSLAASIVFIVLFLVITVLQFRSIYKLRSWFCLAFAIGCLCELVGYISRAAAYDQTGNLPIYIIQSVFLVIAPAFYSASIYMTLGRIIRGVKGEHLSLIRVDLLTKTFIIGDLVSLNVQGSASGLTSKPDHQIAQIGVDIVVVGLFMQLALLGLFFVTAITFQVRLGKRPTRESHTTAAPWRQILYMIYAVSTLIFARSIFRVVEFIQGNNGYSMEHEWTLYVLDAVPMLIVAAVFWVWYPASIQSAIDNVERIELDNSRDKPRRFWES